MTDVGDTPMVGSPSLKEEKTSDPKEDAVDGVKTDEPKAEGGGEEAASSDPNNLYRYVQADLFTSEIFKVEIQNLPKFIGFNDLKKFLEKHRLNPHKIKLFGKQTFAFVTFKNEEERDKAMKMVHGMQWKGRVLSVRLAKPKADPMLRKRERDEAGSAPLSIQIANVVTPLWNVPYEEQLRRKEQEVEGVLQRLAREIGNTNKAMLPWLFVQKEKYKRMCCPLEEIRPSPSQVEYRNKCEFVIGIGANEEDKTIGFRLGKYKGGSCAVVGPSDSIHVTTEAKRVVSEFQKFIRTTPYSVYSPETYEGHWKQLTVRTTRTKQAMAMVFFNPQKLEEKELNVLKSSMKEYFTEGDGKESGVTALYFVSEGQRQSPNPEDLPCELVAGEECIHEELLGLKFRISPHSFFQVNTGAAEVLYSAVGEWAQLDKDSTVLDVCCGTGTIGISLAKRVRKVIGIEMCQEAVKDAKVNAKINDSKVILAIRRAEHLKRLVYVACNAKAAMNNFIDLCRAPSNRVRGAPFRPVRAMAVDLFPQTMHCEMLLLFERVDYSSKSSSEKPEEITQGTSEKPTTTT
uniref:tRNA (uracil(54)-C(5))-methyltransferase n=1 Tax=Oncorhynchus mykiss TaxID=8022 RepID=A0A8C7S5B4_ONCMY